jgi:A/G-specific adenine glycosylase
MLQQTQVTRVIPKYVTFLKRFPTLQDLASAELAEVLKLWSGLGYNRRAMYLYQAAKNLYDKKQPWTEEQLVSCKGIGPNTARAVLVYAYNEPAIFIETNIRSVFIHYFFKDEHTVSDKQIIACIERVINTKDPRSWYWSLMDVGAWLKSQNKGMLHKSSAHKKQPVFSGSLRELRGIVIRKLTVASYTPEQLHNYCNDNRLSDVLNALQDEGLVTYSEGVYYLGR